MAILILVLIVCAIAAGAGLAMHNYHRNKAEDARWEREDAPFWRTVAGKPLRYQGQHRPNRKENA